MSYHNISYHIISYHIISYHIISYHIISYISYHIYHIISYHIISYHIISYHIIPYHIVSCHVISYRIISIYDAMFCPETNLRGIILQELENIYLNCSLISDTVGHVAQSSMNVVTYRQNKIPHYAGARSKRDRQ